MLLERTDQLSALTDALDAVIAGRAGAVVFVGGEAGAGKTVAAARVLRRAAATRRGSSGAPARAAHAGPARPALRRRRGDRRRARGARLARGPAARGRPARSSASWPAARADRPRARGPPLGRRGDARRAAPAGAQGRGACPRSSSPATATTSSTARTRSRSCSESWPRRARSRGWRSRRCPSEAVGELAEPHGIDADELLPPDQRQPVLRHRGARRGHGRDPAHRARRGARARWRASRPRARGLLEAIAIATPQAEIWLLEALAPAELDRLEECLASGMVASRARRRRLPARARPPRRRGDAARRTAGSRCIARPLAALAAQPAGAADPARIAHHADVARRRGGRPALRAGRGGARRVARGAPRGRRPVRAGAALRRRAAARGAGRRCSSAAPTSATSPASSTTAIAAQERALALRRALGDPLQRGRLPALALAAVPLPGAHRGGRRGRPRGGRAPRARRPGARARARLRQPRPPLHDRGGRRAGRGLERRGARARRAARRRPGARLRAHQHRRGRGLHRRAAGARAARAQPRARAATPGWRSTRAAPTSTSCGGRCAAGATTLVDRHLDAGLEYCAERGLDLWRLFLVACRARMELDRGRWTQAADSAPRSSARPPHLAGRRGSSRSRCSRSCARGAATPTSGRALDEALALAAPTGELQRLAPAAAARAEAAWLEGDEQAVAGETEAALELAVRRRAPWVVGDLAGWRRRAGVARADRRRRRAALRGRAGRRRAARGRALGRAGLPVRGGAGPRRRRRRRRRCAAPTTSCSASAPSPPRPSSAAACASAACAACRAARAPRRSENPAGLTAREVEVLGLVGAGPAQRRHRRAALPLGEDRRPPRLGHPAQARRAHARRGERRGPAARDRAPRSVGRARPI